MSFYEAEAGRAGSHESSGTKGYEKCVRMKRTFCSWLSNI